MLAKLALISLDYEKWWVMQNVPVSPCKQHVTDFFQAQDQRLRSMSNWSEHSSTTSVMCRSDNDITMCRHINHYGEHWNEEGGSHACPWARKEGWKYWRQRLTWRGPNNLSTRQCWWEARKQQRCCIPSSQERKKLCILWRIAQSEWRSGIEMSLPEIFLWNTRARIRAEGNNNNKWSCLKVSRCIWAAASSFPCTVAIFSVAQRRSLDAVSKAAASFKIMFHADEPYATHQMEAASSQPKLSRKL